MDTESFVIHIITEDFYEHITNNVEEWFDRSNYNNNRPLPIGKNKKVNCLFKDESSNDDKRLQTFDKITTYPCRTNPFRISERCTQ